MGLFSKLEALLRQINDGKADLKKREDEFYVRQRKAEEELHNKRIKLDAEISETREKKLSALEDEFAKLKIKRLEEVAKVEEAEREHIHAQIAIEREAWLKELEESRKQLSAERDNMERQKGAVSAQQSELQNRKTELEYAEKILERKEERLENKYQKKYDEIDDRLEALLEEERESFESIKQSDKAELERLRDSLRIQKDLLGAFEQLKRQLGGMDPAVVIMELNSKTDELKRLQEELAARPTEEMRERYELLKEEADRQKARADELERQFADISNDIREIASLRRRTIELEADNKVLEQKASRFEGEANAANAELKRLRAPFEKTDDEQKREKAVEAIKIPHFEFEDDNVKKPEKTDDNDEINWLKEIGKKSKDYGIDFNPRILYAFHTALKTAEWSPLTILAGVSGTGKSELPRLYSHFGGLYFEPLSVQPNWDSQESMLGFFNSIDNKFDAQPVLRFLAQSQEKWVDKIEDRDTEDQKTEDPKKKGYPGLTDAVCLVLLDEMNISNPELYFAEFLSKLELRRGMKGEDAPSLSIKIGAGIKPYNLRLGRNVLWTGTMNQDETTKSLSDKVLDRSIIIHFPRPVKLKSREELKDLKKFHPFSPLHRKNWENWWEKDVSNIKENVAPYKEYIEKMNTYLADAGRAIGHRVWQSIEYYMANYPEVRAAKNGDANFILDDAMHKAFEDQLVQKVMPKLRGIDTRGKSRTECLNKILELINTGIAGIGKPFNLARDFDLACELGHGQFMWQTANYLEDDSKADKPKAETSKSKGENKAQSDRIKK